ncbi:hypothetical protein FRB99_006420 [Tulasnella sp. 403]|nr:hypothetical protein FRB99_006420 [Tulasnella sp. 403]
MAGSSFSDSSSATSTLSRTLAIIKTHAIKNRFDIELRISSTGFEIIKERQMAFHAEDSSVRELFGDAASSLCGEPVWIYVLERRRAVEVWKLLMGDEAPPSRSVVDFYEIPHIADPDLARISAPDSLRALYGKSIFENAVYGSPDASMAELQINSVFASSPPFPPVWLGNNHDVPAETLDHQSSVYAASSSAASTNGDSSIRVDVKSKTKGFKARPVPPTIAVPSIQPRSTRAAALRAGVDAPPPSRIVATAESIAKTFENVPGHKRLESIPVASTAPPTIAPRSTRASAFRTGEVPVKPKQFPPRPTLPRKPTSPERVMEIFANVPGHKRRESFSVASTAPPVIPPRPTRASMLRTGQDNNSPSRPRMSTSSADSSGDDEFLLRKEVSFEGVPGHKRNEVIEVPSTRPPSTTPRINKSAALRVAHKEGAIKAPPSSFFMKSVNTTTPNRPPSQASTRGRSSSISGDRSHRSPSVDPSQARPGSVAKMAPPPRPPSITPRTNKSAMLRAQGGAPSAPSAYKVFAF